MSLLNSNLRHAYIVSQLSLVTSCHYYMWAVRWVGYVNTIKCDSKWQPAVVRQKNDPTEFYCYISPPGEEKKEMLYFIRENLSISLPLKATVVWIYLHSLLNLALDESKWSTRWPVHFNLRKNPITQRTEGCVGPDNFIITWVLKTEEESKF
jgi:hypothetical protein